MIYLDGYIKYFKYSNMKKRVIPFVLSCSHYIIQYKLGLIWHTFVENALYDEKWLCSDHQPYLYTNFDTACKKAEELTETYILKHNKEKKAEYKAHIKRIKNLRKSRNKKKYFN